MPPVAFLASSLAKRRLECVERVAPRAAMELGGRIVKARGLVRYLRERIDLAARRNPRFRGIPRKLRRIFGWEFDGRRRGRALGR